MNKMFKKILAVVAALATAACLSVSAFAEGETAEHNAGAVTVTGYAAVTGATQYTVMVFEDSFTTDNDVSKIYYINQGADPAILLNGMLVKATDGENVLPDGDYTVRIGNDATGATVTDLDLKVSTGSVDTKDYLTVTESGKATVNSVAALSTGWLFDGMACRVTIALDATAYPDFSVDSETGLYTKNYTITPVDANGNAIADAEVYFAAQTGKYVVLIPADTAAGYKYEVTAGSNTNTALGMYGDANANGKTDATDKTVIAGLLSGKNTNAIFTSTNQRKLRLDVNGDGKFNATDKTILAGNLNGKVAVLPVFSK